MDLELLFRIGTFQVQLTVLYIIKAGWEGGVDQLSTRTSQIGRQADRAAGFSQAKDTIAMGVLAAPVCHWLQMLCTVKTSGNHLHVFYTDVLWIYPILIAGILHTNNHQYQKYALLTLRQVLLKVAVLTIYSTK
jgi:hypothetical protein